MHIHYFQHVPFEGLGSIAVWAEHRGYTVTVTRFFDNDPLPELDSIDWLLVMGGPMGLYDDDAYPWLDGEKVFIKRAINAGKVVLGICLGAQLIADALGARVESNEHKEIGWFPIQLESGLFADCITDGMEVFHWHGDTFAMPEGGLRIASSVACKNQGFVYRDRVVGLQFHLETTPASARAIIDNSADELVEAPYIQTAEVMLSQPERFLPINRSMDCLLDHLAELT